MFLMISSGIYLILILTGVLHGNANQILLAWISFCAGYICWHIDGLR
nr:MAG TPA: hypothetical protein [Caudoviricetes sp.]